MFLSVSSHSQTGLANVNLADFGVGLQIAVWFLILGGGQCILSTVPLLVRRSMFRSAYARHQVKCLALLQLNFASAFKMIVHTETF